MIKLCGFAASNYYNKVKLCLLEKGLEFEEVLQWPQRGESVLPASPLGKVPFVVTPAGSLCESQVICDWIEAAYPSPPLLPADPFEAAKVRELTTFLDLHLELVARRIYPQALFGRTLPEEVLASTRKDLDRNLLAFSKLAKFAPFVAGSHFTLADCAAIVHLPLISLAGKTAWGEDPLQALPIAEYLAAVADRPSVVRVKAERKQGQEAFAQYLRGGR